MTVLLQEQKAIAFSRNRSARQTRLMMGMPIVVEVVARSPRVGAGHERRAAERVFDLFRRIDATFSTYKPGSEISRLNRGELALADCSADIGRVLQLAEATKEATGGYFDIVTPEGSLDPSGLVKGWAIESAARLLKSFGYGDFYIEAGGDIATSGANGSGQPWRIGIRDPEARERIVKVVEPRGKGVATSGTAVRGAHIWDPFTRRPAVSPYLSLTVIGPDAFEADRFATAAFAMGEKGMAFIEALAGFEAFAVLPKRTALKTSGFSAYEI